MVHVHSSIPGSSPPQGRTSPRRLPPPVWEGKAFEPSPSSPTSPSSSWGERAWAFPLPWGQGRLTPSFPPSCRPYSSLLADSPPSPQPHSFSRRGRGRLIRYIDAPPAAPFSQTAGSGGQRSTPRPCGLPDRSGNISRCGQSPQCTAAVCGLGLPTQKTNSTQPLSVCNRVCVQSGSCAIWSVCNRVCAIASVCNRVRAQSGLCPIATLSV